MAPLLSPVLLDSGKAREALKAAPYVVKLVTQLPSQPQQSKLSFGLQLREGEASPPASVLPAWLFKTEGQGFSLYG